jgi:hypothetical protein
MALAAIGINRPIASFDESSQEAQQINLFYAQARDRVLRDAPWPFATKYAAGQLVSLSEGQDWEHQWEFSYRYPTDCIFVRRVCTVTGRQDADSPPFQIGHDSAGRLIYTDQESAIFEYTARIEDTSRYDAAFVDALTWRLAWYIAMPLAVSDSLRSRADQQYRAAISEAKAIAANERRKDTEPISGSIKARA